MQGLTDGPRIGLADTVVTGLLQSDPSVQVEYGCEWLNSNLALVEDITEYMLAGSTVSSDIYATIHRSCSLVFSSDVPFDYATDFVKPYMVLRNPNTDQSARFNLGVYTLESPDFDLSVSPSALTFSGLDLLHFLDQPIGDSFEIAAGVDPVDVAADLIASIVPGSVVSAAPSGEVTASAYTWAYADSPTYLGVVNDLMSLVGYLGVWVDWDGVFQLVPYVNPTFGSTEWTFDLGSDDNIVAEDRTAQQNFFDVPNWWRFVISNLDHTPVEGVDMVTYIDSDPDNPGSFANRNRLIKRTESVDVISYTALVAYATVSIAADLSPAETFDIKTSPFPLAWHRDLIRMIDPNLANLPPIKSQYRRVLARSWELSLDGSDDMSWVWETVSTSEVT